MTEENETKEEVVEETTETEDEGKPSSTPLLDNATLIHKGLKEENDRTEKHVKELQELESRRMLGGEIDAGKETTPEFTDEQKASRARIKAVADASGSDWGKKYE